MTAGISSCTSNRLKTVLWVTRHASILGFAQKMKPWITYLAGPRSLGTICSVVWASPVSRTNTTEHRLQSTCLPSAQDGAFPYWVWGTPRTEAIPSDSVCLWEGGSGPKLSIVLDTEAPRVYIAHNGSPKGLWEICPFPLVESATPFPHPENPCLPRAISPLMMTAKIQMTQIRACPGCTQSPHIWLACLNCLDIHSSCWPQRTSARNHKVLPMSIQVLNR